MWLHHITCSLFFAIIKKLNCFFVFYQNINNYPVSYLGLWMIDFFVASCKNKFNTWEKLTDLFSCWIIFACISLILLFKSSSSSTVILLLLSINPQLCWWQRHWHFKSVHKSCLLIRHLNPNLESNVSIQTE